MVSDPVVAVGDGQPDRPGIPPFPWSQLRYILTLGGEYCPDTSAKAVPMITHRRFDGIRAEAMESASQSKALVMSAIARAFNESRVRHNLTPAHWRVLLACETGLVPVTDQRGLRRLTLYRPERPDAVLPYDDAPKYIGVRPDLARRYHGEARRAVDDEWLWLHSGWEQ